MSIPVELADLEQTLVHFGSAYLLTASADGRVKAVTVDPSVTDGVLTMATSRGSAANLAANPHATLVFPPSERHGFSLIVDGTGSATDELVTVRPTDAVLHRPGDHADGPPAPGR